MWLRSKGEWWSVAGMVAPLVLAAVLCLVAGWFIKRRRMVWLMDQLPGPRGIPLLGSALEMNRDSAAAFRLMNTYCAYGEVVRVWVGLRPVVFLSGPRAVEALLTNQKNLDKGLFYKFLEPWLGTGLLTASGGKWHSRRKLLTPAFHFKILEDFLEVFNSQSRKMVHKLRGMAGGEAFNVFPLVSLCALDIICETAMGVAIDAQSCEESEYVTAVQKTFKLLVRRLTKIWYRNDFIYNLLGLGKEMDACLATMHKFSRDTIRERKKLFNEAKHGARGLSEEDKLLGRSKKMAFLDLLLEASEGGKALSDEDIREEVDTFMFEGHDTTTTGISWFLYLMGRHPEVQVRVQEELDGIFGGSERPTTMEDTRQMKYTERCIKEALRMFPPVHRVGRTLTEDMEINNYRIPAGVPVVIMIHQLHRNPEQFPDPEKFDPDRFLPENVAKRHPFAYVPFSAGQRNCIGQKFALLEEKVIISGVLRHFRVVSDTPQADLQMLSEVILRPEGGLPLRFLPRTK